MPGSTAEEQPKAKVAESSATNGIFVRPVAVAGIFRPSEDSANKPPALPEKRRFSALSGDLRPVSTGSGGSTNDDFARRRQSWDVKAKDVPFGQNLLKKTPRNSIASPLTSKQDLVSNGSSHEDMSCSDSSSQVSEAKPTEKLNSKLPSFPPSNTSTPDSFISVKEVTVTNDSSIKGKVQTVPNASKFTNQLSAKNQNNISIESSVNVVAKNATGSTTVNSVNQISAAEKSTSKSNTLEKTPNSVDCVKPPKKVYGLMKRDSKPEVTSLRAENSVNTCESKCDLGFTKIEKNVVRKEPQLEIFSKSGNVPDKAADNTLDSLKSKSKVYGLNKTNIRNDIVNENKIHDVKLAESNSINKSVESIVISKVPTSTSVIGKLPETNIASKTSESKPINKRTEINALSKSSEIKEVNKPSENNVCSKSVENKDVNKPSESSFVASKESVVPKSSDSKVALAASKIADKVSEFQKAQSPPKDFRTVRRTSDVIAAKIQNIFSNISTPDKPPPLLAKKSKIQDKSTVSSDFSSTNVLEDKNSNVAKFEQIAKLKDEKQITYSVKTETKLLDESKSQNSDAKNVSKVAIKPIGQEVKIASRRSEGDFNKEECKYKEQAPSVADHSSLKKENKLALESSDVLQSCKVEAVVSLVKADSKTEHSINAAAPSKAQDKKILNIGGKMPIRKQDQKSLEGTASLQATNQDDLKSSNLTAPMKTTFENSNKGSVLKTETVNTCAASSEKVSKTVTSSNSVTSSINSTVDFKNNYISKKIESNVLVKECISSKSTGVSQTSVKTNIVQKTGTVITSCANEITQTSVSNTQKTSQKFINSKDSSQSNEVSKIEVAKITPSVKTSAVQKIGTFIASCANEITQTSVSTAQKTSQKFINSKDTSQSNEVSKIEVAKITPSVKTSTVQKIGTFITSCANEITQTSASNAQKTSQKFINSNEDTSQSNEVSKVEVAKITPSTVPSVVPTVNVLFRTKSPQSSATKEENRKKVVVETYSCSSPVPSAVINSSKISDNVSSRASDSVQEALRTVENVQKSLNSPRLPSKHSIISLKKEELVATSLGPINSSTVENSMPPNASKISDKCSSIESNNSKIETISTEEKKNVNPAIISKAVKDESVSKVASSNSISSKDERLNISEKCETGNHVELKPRLPGNFFKSDSTSGIDDMEKKYLAMDRYSISGPNVNVVDLNDWSKKFQLSESEAPRVPLRRRTGRESMPPALPNRSRFGSLKRTDDSFKYIARSPSHSSLPQRYSYTEMLSKVCSMGVLPYTESALSKSNSSVSSQVSELWSELSEEQSNASHTAEMLESETTERMRLEKEVQDLQNRCSQVQLRSDKMEMEMMEDRVYRTPELNGDLSEDEDGEANSSLYKQKYERAVRDMEIMKRRIQQQHEEETEQKAMLKKASDKRLAEALEDVEEERQVANQWKRKAQKLGSELQDLRLMLEEQMARNGELEKKQRRFDAELSAAQEEIKKERLLREKFAREKDQAMHEKYSLEQDLQSSKLDNDTLHEKITQLNRELDELTLSSKGEEEVTQLKRAKQELERKSRDQEEELEELAAQVGMLEQAKLRLEMSLEKVRQEHRREASVREEEIEEIRASFSKKIKNLEAQLETEQDERHQLMKQKHELERRIYEMADQPPPQDPEIERRLRRDLKRTKALLRDAQSMLEHTREGQSGKTLIRQLKNQLEDSEFAKATAVKARQAVESELHDCQTQLEEATRVKNEVESRCLQLSREKSAIQTQLEEAEEEMAEVMKKYKAVVAQMSIDQKALSEQNQQIADLETERQMLKDQLSEVSHKFEHLAGQSEDTHRVHRLDGKIRDLESKLELEQTTRSRLEHQIARLKEQNERAREECESLRNKELQAQEGVRRLQRQMRELREDYASLQQKEAEAYRKQHELEMALENTETDLQVTKNDLRLACQRIQDLQNALEDDLDSGTDVPDDSGSDSDDSFELSMLRNQSVTPTQRCDSAGSNYSLASEGFRSRTSSFTRELSAFSSRDDDAESKDINGLPGLNTASRLPDVDHVEPV